MKKVSLLLAALTFACVSVFGDYSQVLPLNYEDFFRAEAIAEDGEHLERGAYTSTSGVSIMADQWNRSGKSTDQAGANPVVAASTLEYGNYIDNLKGKEIVLENLPMNGNSTQTRSSIYSLKNTYEYSGAAYYLAALVNITAASGKGDIIAFDGNFTANAQRGRLYINKSGSGYCIGLGWNGDPTTWTSELAFGSTHLVVMKVIPAGNTTEGTEEAAVWVDPDLSKSEAANTPLATLTQQTLGLKSIRGITIRQRSKIAGSIAGLRFGETWADVIQTAEVPSVARIETDFGDTEVWGEVTATTDDAVANTSTINGFEFVKSGLAQNNAKNFNGRILTNRMAIGNQNAGAMVTLPTVSTIERVTIYAQAGSENKDLTLQYFDYATNTWNLIDTYHFEDKNIHVISAELKRNVPTRLRLINADNSKKFIYRIETFPYVTLNRVSTNWSDASTYEGFSLISSSLENKSVIGPSGEAFTPRITMGKQSNGGMIVLPAVTGAAQVDIYASVGGANPSFNLDTYDYSNDTWSTIETFSCAETNTCYRFSKVLNSDQVTKLRIANADGSAKYIWKIVTYPTAPTQMAVPASPAVANVAAHSFTAKWTAVTGASGYRVVVFNNDESRKTTQEIEGGDIIQYNFKNLDPETDYTFKVSAKGDGETTIDSELSEAVAVKTASEIDEVYTRTVTNGNYGTICLPKASANLSAAGAVFFKVAGKIMDGSALQEVVFDEVTALEAGVPYVFLAEADELNIQLTGDAVDAPNNENSNGLIGSFTVASVGSSVYRFILKDNKLYCTKNQAYYVGENRAYFKIDDMPDFDNAAPAPGRRRISMSVEQEQNATGIENAEFINGVQKRIENGQLFIIRNGVKYNAAGQIVK